MPRALITGGAGFVGSHLVDRYLRDGWEIVAVDSLLTGSLANLSEARSHRAFTFLERNVAGDPATTSAQLAGEVARCELVLHFASPASPVDYVEHPIETMRVNSLGTESCALLALTWGARLLFASTSEAYGDPKEHPQRETYWGNVNPVGPRSCYDESKRFGEALVMTYARARGLDSRIIRIFNTYGPRMRKNDGRVVPNFIMQALQGRPLTVYGDGSQTRSFCYVDDLIEGIVRCAASEATRDRVVNLGNPEEHTIAEFAAAVSQIAGVALKIEPGPLPTDDPARRRPDISLAKSLIGWEPRVSLEEGIRRTIESMRPVPAVSVR
ncbi:MAG TPA: UDP-glucuronic acid decarboxylase family protein [Verrucomicrobiae bacterium]|nr:UDP-glucuronic acid decarboxylase family protein [Verrucomicrobiae bacterium]